MYFVRLPSRWLLWARGPDPGADGRLSWPTADASFSLGTLYEISRNLSMFTFLREQKARVTKPVSDTGGFPVLYVHFPALLGASHSNKNSSVGPNVREQTTLGRLGWATTSAAPWLRATWPNHSHFCSCMFNTVHVFMQITISHLLGLLEYYTVTSTLKNVANNYCNYLNTKIGTLESPVILDWRLPVLDWSLEVDTEFPLSDSDSDIPCQKGMETDRDSADHRDTDAGDADGGKEAGGVDVGGPGEAGESSEYANTPTKKKRKRTKKTKTKSKAQRTRNPSPAKEPETFANIERAKQGQGQRRFKRGGWETFITRRRGQSSYRNYKKRNW